MVSIEKTLNTDVFTCIIPERLICLGLRVYFILNLLMLTSCILLMWLIWDIFLELCK